MKENIELTNLCTEAWENYALIDSGEGRKLEKYGKITVDRPEPQALWAKTAPELWGQADAKFNNSKDEESENGNWELLKNPPHEWAVKFQNLTFQCRLMSFRHMGLFPEQASHWELIQNIIKAENRPLKILNLFAYTGASSLAAAELGCEVTHLDASKKAITWAKENQTVSNLRDKKIRWICDDAAEFVEREIRRGNQYDAIILDPPKYGRGPDGQIWSLEKNLPEFLENCVKLLSNEASFMLLTCYALRLSPFTLKGLMNSYFSARGGIVEAGELLIKPTHSPHLLATSLYSLWRRSS